MKNVISAILALPIGIATIALIMFALANSAGILVGFEHISPACSDYRNHRRTNFDKLFFPISPYACKENAGLLQPAVSNAFEWLQKVE